MTPPLEIMFNAECILRCPEFKIIEHPFKLILIGADVLRAGFNDDTKWVYRAIGGEKDPKTGGICRFVEFLRGEEHQVVPIACAPLEGGPRIIKRLEVEKDSQCLLTGRQKVKLVTKTE